MKEANVGCALRTLRYTFRANVGLHAHRTLPIIKAYLMAASIHCFKVELTSSMRISCDL